MPPNSKFENNYYFDESDLTTFKNHSTNINPLELCLIRSMKQEEFHPAKHELMKI